MFSLGVHTGLYAAKIICILPENFWSILHFTVNKVQKQTNRYSKCSIFMLSLGNVLFHLFQQITLQSINKSQKVKNKFKITNRLYFYHKHWHFEIDMETRKSFSSDTKTLTRKTCDTFKKKKKKSPSDRVISKHLQTQRQHKT